MKILDGQDPSCVWVGWVTSNFNCYDRTFDLERVCSVTVTLGDQWGKVLERSVILYPAKENITGVTCLNVKLPGLFDVSLYSQQ